MLAVPVDKRRLAPLQLIRFPVGIHERALGVIPDDPLPPFRPSGIRLGTPALTTRGLTEEHMAQLADWMLAAIQARNDESKLASIKGEVVEFARQYPLPSDK